MSTRSKRARADAAAVPPPDADAAALPATAAAAPAAAAAAAAPRSSKKKAPAATEQEATMTVSAAAAAAAAAAPTSEWTLSGLLLQLGGRASPSEGAEAAAQLRTLQQTILRQANTRASDLLHPDLWPAFLARLQRVQANTVRLDVHLLTALARTLTGAFAAHRTAAGSSSSADDASASFALLPTLQRVVELLLPCDGTPVSESWVSTFHPNHELLSGVLSSMLRLALGAAAAAGGDSAASSSATGGEIDVGSLPAAVWNLYAAMLSAFTLVNAAQPSQRKVYEQTLQDRNLPVWASLHRAVQNHLTRVREQQSGLLLPSSKEQLASMRLCARRIEGALAGSLFHAEHLPLYADALGMHGGSKAEEEEEEDEEDSEEEAEAGDVKAKDGEEDEEMQDGAPKEEEEGGEQDGDDAKAPLSKKAKTATAASASKKNRKSDSNKAAAAPHKPLPNNYTHKLFDAVAAWLDREEGADATATSTQGKAPVASGKKRKDAPGTDASAPASAPSAFSSPSVPALSRSIRSLLPLLFSSYLRASEALFQSMYPLAGSQSVDPLGGGGEVREVAPLSGVELRRRKVKEKQKGERELKMLQKMWSLNERSPTLARMAASLPAASSSSPSLVAPLYRVPLTPQSLPLLHDVFATSSRLFREIHRSDLYRIHQDANVGPSAAGVESAFTGVKRVLAEQVHAIMSVARALITAKTSTEMQEEGGKKKGKSSSSNASTSSTDVTPAALLSLSIPLAHNLLHLLQLNPEFIQRYLFVRSTASATATSHKGQAEVNVWHLVWKVQELDSKMRSESAVTQEEEGVLSTTNSLSSPPHALPSLQRLSRAIFLSFSRQRSYDVLLNSYMSAARSARQLDAELDRRFMASFESVNGAGFDLAGLMRAIPPLRVPSLWEWFLTQCALHLSPSSSASVSPASTQVLLETFAYFLDTLLVREEIAVQLQGLYARTAGEVVAKAMREALEAQKKQQQQAQTGSETKESSKGSRKSKAPSTSASMDVGDASSPSSSSATPLPLPLPSLLLLLHSLNGVKAQCDQHTTKTYETMLAPLPGFFAGIDSVEGGGAAAEEGAAVAKADEMRLTEVITSLTSSSPDPRLLHALQLLSLQRLGQLHRYVSRNIVTNIFAAMEAGEGEEEEEQEAASDSDEEEGQQANKMEVDSDGDEVVRKPRRAKITGDGAPKRAPESRAAEATFLTAFLLRDLSACDCSLVADAGAHAALRWDGAVSSLAPSRSGSGSGRGAAPVVALWKLITSHLDIVAHFATEEQRREIVRHILSISGCAWCNAATAEGSSNGTGGSESAAPVGHTLHSLTRSLLAQSWLYEVAPLRRVLMDVALSQVLQVGSGMFERVEKGVRKAAGKVDLSAVAPVEIPEEFGLTAAMGAQLASLQQLALYTSTSSSAAPAPSSSGAPASVKSLWSSLWVLQLLRSLPAQFLAHPPFHALLVQLLWGLECVVQTHAAAASAAASTSTASEEPLRMGEIAQAVVAGSESEEVVASLLSHLSLASRRMLLSSLTSLSSTSAPVLLPLVTPALLEWVCFESFRSAGARASLRGRHVAFARATTQAIVRVLGPMLVAAGAGAGAGGSKAPKATGGEEKKEAAEGEKKDKKKDKKDANVDAATSVLLPLVDRIHSTLSALSPSSPVDASTLWCVDLASALVDSFTPSWDASTQSQSPFSGAGAAGGAGAELGKAFRLLLSQAGATARVVDILNKMGKDLSDTLLPMMLGSGTGVAPEEADAAPKKSSRKSSKPRSAPATTSSSPPPAELVGSVLDLSARLLVTLFASRSSVTEKEHRAAAAAALSATGGGAGGLEDKFDVSGVTREAAHMLALAVKVLTNSDASAEAHKAQQGAVTFVHALCISLPLFTASSSVSSSTAAAISFPLLLDALFRVACADAQGRLARAAALASTGATSALLAPSALTGSIEAAFMHLMNYNASPAPAPAAAAEGNKDGKMKQEKVVRGANECAQIVELLLAQLDVGMLYVAPSTGDSAPVNSSARLSATLGLLHVYMTHMHSLPQRQALGSAPLSLLFYRLAALSARWAQDYLSRSSGSGATVSLMAHSLALLAHVLTRSQSFTLDDPQVSMLAQTVTNAVTMLRDSFARSDKEKERALARGERLIGSTVSTGSFVASFGPSASALSAPLYMVLYALLKSHAASSVVKIVPIYLGWLRAMMEDQWRRIQHRERGQTVPLSLSENLSRLLEELGRPAHSKLFNKYAVGTLLDWIALSKHKGAAWGTAEQEPHVRAVQKGLFAVIGICEEHDLGQLHNLLDVSGRTIFKSLHQAYKKTKFTGLV